VELKVVYRSYSGDNRKDRPAYYDKTTTLLSFLRAVKRVDAEVVFMNDGDIPPERLRLMQKYGETIRLPYVGMRHSYIAGLRLARQRRWPDRALVWFSEDDYLYRPESFQVLGMAAAAIPADYFGLCGSTSPSWRPAGWQPSGPYSVDGQRWVRSVSVTSTFGGRAGTVAADMSIFLQCLLPHRRSYRDHDTCVVYQGYQPHHWRQLFTDMTLQASGTGRERLRLAALAPFKAGLNIRSRRLRSNRRVLVVADPNLACHMEVENLSPGTDWAEVAKDSVRWAQ
jgi:hypothetical protein